MRDDHVISPRFPGRSMVVILPNRSYPPNVPLQTDCHQVPPIYISIHIHTDYITT